MQIYMTGSRYGSAEYGVTGTAGTTGFGLGVGGSGGIAPGRLGGGPPTPEATAGGGSIVRSACRKGVSVTGELTPCTLLLIST